MRTVHATIMVVCPFLVFTTSIFFASWATGLPYALVWNLLYLAIVCYLGMYITAVARTKDPHESKSKWRRWSMRLTQVAAIAGVICGSLIYFHFFIFYDAYRE